MVGKRVRLILGSWEKATHELGNLDANLFYVGRLAKKLIYMY